MSNDENLYSQSPSLKPLTKGLGFHSSVKKTAVNKEDQDQMRQALNLARSQVNTAYTQSPRPASFAAKKQNRAPQSPVISKEYVEPSYSARPKQRPGQRPEQRPEQRPRKRPVQQISRKTTSEKRFSLQVPRSSEPLNLTSVRPKSSVQETFASDIHFNAIKNKTAEVNPRKAQSLDLEKTILCSPLAFVIDISMLASVYLFALFMLSSAMGFGLAEVINLKGSAYRLALLGSVFFFLLGGYYTFLNILFGRTLGGWAAALSLGGPRQVQSFNYPFQIFFRFVVLCVTGWVLLPILSAFLKIDLLKSITGLGLVSEPEEN